MDEKPITERLTFLGNKLRQMWGNNPDTDLIFEAVEAMKAPAPKAKRTPKKDTPQ